MNDYVATVDEFLNRILNPNEYDRLDNRHRDLIEQMRNEFGGTRDGNSAFGRVNFYPSDATGHCCKTAFFVSLKGKRWNIRLKDKIHFAELYDYIIQHCQGSCAGQTYQVIIITDNWDDDIANKWKQNIEVIKSSGVQFHVFVITGTNRCYGSL